MPPMALVDFTVNQKVAIITLNNPAKRNALSRDLVKALNTALHDAQEDTSLNAILLQGAGKSFCAGADITEFAATASTAQEPEDFIQAWEFIGQVTKPIVARVQGFTCGGGVELALMTDYIIAAESALLAMPEITLGLIPGCGGTQRLLLQLGYHRAFELCAIGHPITAQTAHAWGLVNEVVPEEALYDIALQRAQSLARQSTRAIATLKHTLKDRENQLIREGLQKERAAFWALAHSPEGQEGVNAFLEKRQPRFSN